MKINVHACTLDNSLHNFSSYNTSILVFQKMINKYNKTFNKKIYSLNAENVAQNFVRLARHFLPATCCFNVRYFPLKALKVMEILSREQMRGPRKM